MKEIIDSLRQNQNLIKWFFLIIIGLSIFWYQSKEHWNDSSRHINQNLVDRIVVLENKVEFTEDWRNRVIALETEIKALSRRGDNRNRRIMDILKPLLKITIK